MKLKYLLVIRLIVLTHERLKKCTMPVSVGVAGALNGRSASSPTGNSAVNTSSFPTQGGADKSKASGGPSPKNSPDLHQKTIQKTKDKVRFDPALKSSA